MQREDLKLVYIIAEMYTTNSTINPRWIRNILKKPIPGELVRSGFLPKKAEKYNNSNSFLQEQFAGEQFAVCWVDISFYSISFHKLAIVLPKDIIYREKNNV